MGWSNSQATSLDGQAFTYTNTTVDYSTGSALTVDSGATLNVGSTSKLTASSGSTVDVASGAAVTVDSGASLAIASGATFTVNGRSPALGVIAYYRILLDSPFAGTAATTAATAATVITTTASVVKGRIYQITCPGLAVRMNVAARTGVQIDITEDGTAPTPNGPNSFSQYVNCPTAGSPVPCPLSTLYVPSFTSTGTLKVLVSIWNVSGGGATTANGSGGPNFNPVEVMVIDLGTDPGAVA